ncbi:interleukin-5 receptor subunit alpha-like isoform X1 [Arapaima gigas]
MRRKLADAPVRARAVAPGPSCCSAKDMLFTLPLSLFWAVLATSCVPGHQYNVTAGLSIVPRDEFLVSTLSPKEDTVSEVDEKEAHEYNDDQISSADNFDDEIVISIYMDKYGHMVNVANIGFSEQKMINMNDIYNNQTLPEGVHRFLVKNLSCILYNNSNLNCTWVTLDLPVGAQHSVTVIQQRKNTSCDCFTNLNGTVTGCHGKIDSYGDTAVQINVSFPNFWYIHKEEFDLKDIEKLNPPHNVTALVKSDNLVITWDPPTVLRHKCFQYQIEINNELTDVLEHTTYMKPNLALDKKYLIRVRVTKTSFCRENNIWSDWSETVEVSVAQKPFELNGLKIAAISLGIPMFLLAVLLVCRQSRIMAILFPTIPSPSIKVKQLLDTEVMVQVMQSKYTEEINEVDNDHD